MRGRKPVSPKVRDLAAGKLHLIHGDKNDAAATSPVSQVIEPPEWIKDSNARAEWQRLLPELQVRKQYLPLFASELARYCVAFGQYITAILAMDASGGPVTKSSKDIDMLSMHWVVANRAHETMAKLAGDLGLNPVAQVRLAGLQLDLFQQPQGGTATGDPRSNNPFGAYRR